LEVLHQEVRRHSIEKFRCARKMGGEEMSRTYQQELENEVLELYSKKKPTKRIFSENFK
jgi:hypothetical protein